MAVSFVGKVVSNFQDFISINPSTLSGAIDIVVIKLPNNSFVSSPFHIRFGKLLLLKPNEKKVLVSVNNLPVDLQMKVGDAGEAFFVVESDSDVNTEYATSPIVDPIPFDSSSIDDLLLDTSDIILNTPNPNKPSGLALLGSQKSFDGEITPTIDTNFVLPDPHSTDDTTPTNINVDQSVHFFSNDKNSLNSSMEIYSSIDNMASNHDVSDIFSSSNNLNNDFPVSNVNPSVDQGAESISKHFIQNDTIASLSSNENNASDAPLVGLAITHDQNIQDIQDLNIDTISTESLEFTNSENPTGFQLGDILANSTGDAERVITEPNQSENLDTTEIGNEQDPKSLPVGSPQATWYWTWGALPSKKKESAGKIDEKQDSKLKSDVLESNINNSNDSLDIQKQEHGIENVGSPSQSWSWWKQDKITEGSEQKPKSSLTEALAKSQDIPIDERVDTYLASLPSHEPVPSISLQPTSPTLSSSPVQKEKPIISKSLFLNPDGSLAKMELSLCGAAAILMALGSQKDFATASDVFSKQTIPFETFSSTPAITTNPNLVFRINGSFFTWTVVSQVMLSTSVFGKIVGDVELTRLVRESVLGEQGINPQANEVRKYSSFSNITSWWSRAASPSVVSDDRLATSPIGSAISDPEKKPTKIRRYVKSLRLTSDQLKSLNLQKGSNTITFSVTSTLQGTATCSSKIYLWDHDTKVVISDVDGTITKSDVLGHVFTMVGKDWTHSGVASLYTNIHNNGYQFLYLTSRAIGQANSTRDYLKKVEQGAYQLPAGPVIMSPDRLFTAFHRYENANYREVIQRRPEEFKIACLRDIKKLFGNSAAPFYAGFGNRVTDVQSYKSVGVPTSRIFTIDPSGNIKLEFSTNYKSSYIKLNDIVGKIFPPVSEGVGEGNDMDVWKSEIPDAGHTEPQSVKVEIAEEKPEEEFSEDEEDDHLDDESKSLADLAVRMREVKGEPF